MRRAPNCGGGGDRTVAALAQCVPLALAVGVGPSHKYVAACAADCDCVKGGEDGGRRACWWVRQSGMRSGDPLLPSSPEVRGRANRICMRTGICDLLLGHGVSTSHGSKKAFDVWEYRGRPADPRRPSQRPHYLSGATAALRRSSWWRCIPVGWKVPAATLRRATAQHLRATPPPARVLPAKALPPPTRASPSLATPRGDDDRSVDMSETEEERARAMRRGALPLSEHRSL
eukprot:gene12515-biopygen9024